MYLSRELHKKINLLSKIDYSLINEILICLDTKEVHFKKGDSIYNIGDTIQHIGILLHGTIQVSSIDFWGNKSILVELDDGDTFGEVYAISQETSIPLQVVALTDLTVLFIHADTLFNRDTLCPNKQLFIQHLLQEFTRKNIFLSKKIEHLSKRSIREKLYSYLSTEAIRQNSPTFEIAFNRQELADYLAIDRSACSAELSRMKKEGILDYHKNRFCLLKKQLT